MSVVCSFLLGVLLAIALTAQTSKPLTNEDVVQMVKAGLPDDIVVTSIQRSQTNFDVSPEGLIHLKENGASTGVMKAMLATTAGNGEKGVAASNADRVIEPAKVTTKETPQIPDAPLGTGVYYKADAKWIEMPMAPTASSKTISMKTMLLHSTITPTIPKPVYIFSGEKSPVQFREGRQVFYVSGMGGLGSERNSRIVRFKTKKDHREIIGRGETVDVTVTRVSDKVFTVTPGEELKPGEYLLDLGQSASAYDFGIAGK